MKFGEKVRQARIAAHLSQQQLADRSGISLRTIQNYETGGRMPKQRDSYRRLASALHMEVSVLLDEQAEFVLAAGEEYGSHGSEQAQRLVEEISGLYAGGYAQATSPLWTPFCIPALPSLRRRACA